METVIPNLKDKRFLAILVSMMTLYGDITEMLIITTNAHWKSQPVRLKTLEVRYMQMSHNIHK